MNNQQEILSKIEAPRQNNVIEYENTVYFDRNQPTKTSSYTITDTKPEYAVETKTIQTVGKPNTKSSTTSASKKGTKTKSHQTSTKAATSTKKTTSTTSPATYNYTTKKGLDTSTSIVDALKATGANSSMAARKEIAEANGIKNYTGTAAQNNKMLNMMKSGDLVKPTSSTSKSSSSKSSSSKSSSSKRGSSKSSSSKNSSKKK